ncbi:Uncharacterized copper-binding protein, cupredoxin-like subfamily [Tistlia consotensis]|uniref:Uncharacterized copper-binding protein, cupredoxin-like subfamily n=1 Tax=Tistlia consotensis USBA 355 TaxID=560819 RepID=A0A1Y6CJC3_9PROT|nr:cupredoxin family protein [Tistlia consotensis]SMF57743.1 Uncharacterized copper-binding protein, cupredoxin-like subfamily [Tistlia consotensis USBA 355]SNR45875.1 Uncharacterized copper-binding protein, cupredoxin-like subfamily [Tistlia consotensis]
MTTRLLALTSIGLLSGAVLFAAGPALATGDHAGRHGSAALGQPGRVDLVARTVEIVMGDNYYEPEQVSVAAGETVRFLVRNDGSLVHEFSLGTARMHAAHREEMQMMVAHGVLLGDRIDRERMTMDMGDGRTMAHDDPNSLLLEPGQSAELVWTFGKAGTLEFACNVPGHYEAGMAGSLVVQD